MSGTHYKQNLFFQIAAIRLYESFK